MKYTIYRDDGEKWEQDVRDMWQAYQNGHDEEVRRIRDNMSYCPPYHTPSREASDMLKKMGEWSGVWPI